MGSNSDVGSLEVGIVRQKLLDGYERIFPSDLPIVRPATRADISRLVELEFIAWDDTLDPEMPKSSIEEQREFEFSRRLANAGTGMVVGEVDGTVEGWATIFPTNKTYRDIDNWEDATNNGTLDGCVEAGGRHMYIANLTVTPAARGKLVTESLISKLYQNMIEQGADSTLLLSRMQRANLWTRIKLLPIVNELIADISEANQDSQPRPVNIDDVLANAEVAFNIAKIYANQGKIKGDRFIFRDPLLSTYSDVGVFFRKVVPVAMDTDEESLRAGVVGEAPNPVPAPLRVKPVNKMAARLLGLASKNPTFLKSVF